MELTKLVVGLLIGGIVVCLFLMIVVRYICAKWMNIYTNAKNRGRIRRFYFYFRSIIRIPVKINGYILLILCLVGCCLFIPYIFLSVYANGITGFISTISDYLRGMLIMPAMVISLKYILAYMSRPISYMTMKNMEDIDNNFVIYLRGINFDNKDYLVTENSFKHISLPKAWTATSFLQRDNIISPDHLPLNECSLANAWGLYYDIYTVGEVHELESPVGCKRIYIDYYTDINGSRRETWKDDVLCMMEKAKYILICPNTSVNCVWEIEQANKLFPKKTIYYIDNIERLQLAKRIMGKNFPKCLRSENINRNHIVVYPVDNNYFIEDYTNDFDGLQLIASKITHAYN